MQGKIFTYHFRAAQVQGLLEVGLGDPQDALHAVINESEAARLQAIAPHLDVLWGGQHLQPDKLSAQGHCSSWKVLWERPGVWLRLYAEAYIRLQRHCLGHHKRVCTAQAVL